MMSFIQCPRSWVGLSGAVTSCDVIHSMAVVDTGIKYSNITYILFLSHVCDYLSLQEAHVGAIIRFVCIISLPCINKSLTLVSNT